MASNINPFNIDGTYPIAGQDNDSQGFRDNFTNIRNNLSFAKSEVEDLQSKVVLKTALTGTVLDNNFGGAPITNAQLQGVSETISDHGTAVGLVLLDYSQANAHTVTTSGSINISFANWPAAGLYGSMRLVLTVTNATYTMFLPITSPGITNGASDIAGLNTATGELTFDVPGTYLFNFSTVDGGQTVLIEDMSRNRESFRGSALYYDQSVRNDFFVGFGAGLSTAQGFEQSLTTVKVLGGLETMMVGDLSAGGPNQSYIDTSSQSGVSILGARGNLATASTSAVQSNDFLGQVNALAFTGNGGGTAIQNVSSIGFFATGANLTYGLGGNVAIFTANDGAQGPARLVQAVGFENDQSIKLLGNLLLSTNGISSTYVPATSNAAGTPGQVAWDSTYFYVCTGPSAWKRTAWGQSTW
jgi:hypothetical protein